MTRPTALRGGGPSHGDAEVADEQVADAELVASWSRLHGQVLAVLDCEALTRTVRMVFGPVAGETAVAIMTNDALIHTWDLAHATGGDEHLDEHEIRHSYETYLPMDELLRGPGMFGAKVDPPARAGIQTVALCFYGRQP